MLPITPIFLPVTSKPSQIGQCRTVPVDIDFSTLLSEGWISIAPVAKQDKFLQLNQLDRHQ